MDEPIRTPPASRSFATGDMATLDQLIADDAVWHTSGRNRLTGDFEGKEAIFGSFARLKQATDAQQDIHAIVADDDHTVALAETTVTRGAQTLRDTRSSCSTS